MVGINRIYKTVILSIILIGSGVNLFAQNDTSYKYYPDGTIRLSHYYKSTRLDTTPPRWDTYQELTTYFENGQKRSFEVRRNGDIDSLYIEWFDNGQKRLQGSYKMGKRDGIWLHWYKTGELLGVSYFKDDKQEGIQYNFFKNGAIERIVTYKDSLANGPFFWYYENGNIRSKANFVNGKGTRYVYDETGKLIKEYYYIQFPFTKENYHKQYTDKGYEILYSGIYGVYLEEYYDKNGVKYKIVKIDKDFNREVINLKDK